MSTNLWVVRKGQSKVEFHSGPHPDSPALYQTFNQLRAEGHTPIMRSEKESKRQVQTMADYGVVHRTMGEERMGRGHSLSPTQFGMVVHNDAPSNVADAHDLVGPSGMYAKADRDDEGGPWTHLSTAHTFTPEHELHTTQQYLSGTHIERETSRLRGGRAPLKGTDPYSGVKVFRDDDGSHWVLDGHHRLAVGRQAGRPVRGRLMTNGALDVPREWAAEAHEEDY